jgi:hypothetical protein
MEMPRIARTKIRRSFIESEKYTNFEEHRSTKNNF